MTKKGKPFKWIKKIRPFKRLKLLIKRGLGWLGKPVIIPYTGYGNQDEIFFIGCVSEDKGLEKPKPSNTKWQNLLSMMRRFSADTIPGVRVKATFLGLEHISVTDNLGIFRMMIDLRGKEIRFPGNHWVEIKLELLDPIRKQHDLSQATGKVLLIRPGESSFGIISDIDDTILVSHSYRFIQKFRLMLFKNALTRLPFEGVAGFYRALNKGKDEHHYNPIFYVSNSQWNLFDLLTEFCNFRKIPEGVMFLQEFRPFKPKRIIKRKRAIAKHPHKLDKIRSILSTYEELNFVLIGDSGQKDAEIYEQIATEFPERVMVIYIRDIRKSREKRVLHLGTTLKKHGIEVLLIKNTIFAAQHALKLGLISDRNFEEVINEEKLDESYGNLSI